MDPTVDQPPSTAGACPEVRWQLLARLEGVPVAPAAWAAVERHLAACSECPMVRDDAGFLRACCRSAPWLDALRAGTLPPAAARALVAHLVRCAACRRAALPAAEADTEKELGPRVPAAAAKPRPSAALRPLAVPGRRRAWVGASLLAAAAIVPAGAALTSAHRSQPPSRPPVHASTGVTVESARTGRVSPSRLSPSPTPSTTASTSAAPQAKPTSPQVIAAAPPRHARGGHATTAGAPSTPHPTATPTPAPTASPSRVLPPLPVP